MKKITAGDKTLTLDIGEDIRVKDLRRITPLAQKYKDNDVEMVCQVINALALEEDSMEIIDNLTQEEFAEVGEQLNDIMNGKKKKQKE